MGPGLIASLATKSPAPMMATTGADVYGSTLRDSYERGMEPDAARARAGIAALLEGGTELFPATKILGMGKGGWSKGLKSLVQAAGAEAVQEGFVEAANTVADEIWDRALDDGLKGHQNLLTVDGLSDTAKNVLYAAWVGGGVGAGLRGGVMTSDAAFKRIGQARTTDEALEAATDSVEASEREARGSESLLSPQEEQDAAELELDSQRQFEEAYEQLDAVRQAADGLGDLTPEGQAKLQRFLDEEPTTTAGLRRLTREIQGIVDKPPLAPEETETETTETAAPTTTTTVDEPTPTTTTTVDEPTPTTTTPAPTKPKKRPIAGTVAPTLKQGKTVPMRVDGADPDKSRYDVEVSVMDADDLVTSHDAYGNADERYPNKFQPRDRSEAKYVRQMQKIASDLNPSELADTGQAATGAPVVRPSGVVLSGNGRTAGVKMAYDSPELNSDEYRAWAIEQAKAAGIDPAEVEGMAKPVLVRVLSKDMRADDLVAFTKAANRAPIQQASGSEQAVSDAELMEDDFAARYAPDMDGDALATSNIPWLNEFSQLTGAQHYSSEGGYSGEMRRRVENAMFAKAYGGELASKLIQRKADEGEGSKKIINALQAAAAQFVGAKSHTGDFDTLDVVTPTLEAIDLLERGCA